MVDKSDIQTVYVTKYWQIRGIFELRAEIISRKRGPSYASTIGVPGENSLFLRMGTEAFFSRTEAKAQVQTLAAKKIKLLRKQLAKLEKACPEAAKVK